MVSTVQELATVLLDDFNVRWGTGMVGTVFIEKETKVPRRCLKWAPKLALLAAAVDPRTKSLNGIPEMEHEMISKYLEQKMMEFAFVAAIN